jgi:hypothetical protein
LASEDGRGEKNIFGSRRGERTSIIGGGFGTGYVYNHKYIFPFNINIYFPFRRGKDTRRVGSRRELFANL